ATIPIGQQGIIIPSTTLEYRLADLDVSVDVVEMYVEGAVRLCLPGSYLEHVREIVVESHGTEDTVVRILEKYGFKTSKISFRVPRTVVNILRQLPYFVGAELATNFMISRSTLRAFMKHEHLLLRERQPQFQIIYGRRS